MRKREYQELMDLRQELDTAKFMIARLIDAGVDMERRVNRLELTKKEAEK